jgi:hypothetical protein
VTNGSDIPSPVLLKDLAAQSWQLYRDSAASLVATFFVAFLALSIFVNGIASAVSGFGDDTATGNQISSGDILLYLVLVVVLPLLVGSISFGIASVMLTDRVCGRPATAWDAWRQIVPRLGQMLVGVMATVMIVLIGFMLVGPIFGQLIIVPMLVGPPIALQAMVLEGTPFRGGLVRLRALMKGSWTRMPMYLFTIALGLGIVQLLAFQGLARPILAVSSDTLARVLLAVTSAVVPAIVLPYQAAAQLVAYFDLRARMEGLDHAQLVAERQAKAALPSP